MILSIKKTNDTVFPLHTPHTLYFKIINYCYFENYSETLNFYKVYVIKTQASKHQRCRGVVGYHVSLTH